jgi:hypothetical protein
MPSLALSHWFAERSAALVDEIENAHHSVGGTGPGRRYATQQINQAYAVLLSSQFQGFCRDLHTECADCVVRPVAPADLRIMLRAGLLFGRRVDSGNPNPGNLGSDFNRFSLRFWQQVDAHRPHNPQRRASLEELNEWRKAIAHQNFTPAMLRGGRPILHLSRVQNWWRACEGLPRSFEEVMRVHIEGLTGTSPW